MLIDLIGEVEYFNIFLHNHIVSNFQVIHIELNPINLSNPLDLIILILIIILNINSFIF